MPDILSLILALVAMMLYKLFDELQDESVNSFWDEPFLGLPVDFLNKDVSWKNKWKLDKDGKGIWATSKDRARYLWIYKPTLSERFPYSSTFLVWLTDGEHLFQFFKDLCIGLSFWAITGSWILGLGAWMSTYLVGFIKEMRKV